MMGQIKKAFSSLCYEVSMSTSLNQLSINVHAEQFFVELLNELFTYNLVNTNSEEKNFASIDLLDTGNRIAFQITSDSSLKKIKDTLSKLCEKKLHEKVDRIIVLNLIKKNNHKNETLEKDSFKINLKKDIWDYTDLISEINNLNIDRLTSIHALINKYLNPTILFPLPEQDLTSSTIHKLLNGISKLKPIVHPKLPDTTPYTTEAKVSHNNIYQYLKHFDRFQKFAWNIQAQIDYLEENSAPGVAEQLFNYVEQIWMDVSFNEDNPDIIIKKICNEIKDELTKTTSNILTLEDIRYIPFMVFFVFSKCKIFEKPPC